MFICVTIILVTATAFIFSSNPEYKWTLKNGAAVAQRVEPVDKWSDGRWFESELSCISKYLYPYVTPKLLLMCSWHLAWRPLPSSLPISDELMTCPGYTCLRQERQLGLAPVTPRDPLNKDKGNIPGTLTDKAADIEMRWTENSHWPFVEGTS